MDFSTYSLADLRSIASDIENEINRREKFEMLRIRKELELVAKQAGYSLAKIIAYSDSNGTRSRDVGSPKYRHPKYPDLIWSGRGRQPRWILDYLRGGGALEELVVNNSAEAG